MPTDDQIRVRHMLADISHLTFARRWLPHERCEATITKLRLVTLRRPGRAFELPFNIAAMRFNARAELIEYPPPAMIDPGVTVRVPGVIGDDPAVRVGVMVAR